MISQATKTISEMRHRRTVLVGIVGLFSLVAAACSVQETNAYPVDLFTEMHYSQAQRAQEPPRLQPPAETVAFESAGGPEASLAVPEFQRRDYNPAVAADLYAVNCAVCHGVNGLGDGPAVAHLRNNQSYYTTSTGQVMGTDTGRRLPPNLQESALRDNDAGLAAFIRSGGNSVMPQFEKFLTEEEIWDIVAYIQDRQTGLGTAQ